MVNLSYFLNETVEFVACNSDKCSEVYSKACENIHIFNNYYFMIFFAISFLCKNIISICVWQKIKLKDYQYRLLRQGIDIFNLIGWIVFAIEII